MSKQSESVHSRPLPTDPEYDGELAKTNTEKTLMILRGGGWFTVQELAPLINATETATSSALRDLRKPKYGRYNIFRRRLENNISEYKLFEDGYTPSQKELTNVPGSNPEPKAVEPAQQLGMFGIPVNNRRYKDPG